MSKRRELPEEVKRLLKQVYDDCMKEDTSVRERQIRKWKQLKLLWEGFSRIWYSEVAHDWRIWDFQNDDGDDQSYYDKPVNVFKAYLESIIAALSVAVPPVKCFPDDADNTLDLATARAGDKIAQLVYRHNDAPLLWLHMLFINMTEGMVAAYSYEDYDDDYGTYERDKTEDIEEEKTTLNCTICGAVVDENIEDQQEDKFDPGDEDAQLDNALNNDGMELCPSCMKMMKPELKTESFITTRIIGKIKEPKGRICIESYGGLYVKIPNYCKTQCELPYLIFSEEKDYSIVVEEFEDLHGNKKLIESIKNQGGNPGGEEFYAQWGRLNPQYQGEYPENVVTVNKAWIRTAKFNILPDKEDIKKLKELFPDGVKLTVVNDEFADACNESLDDHWTLTENPLSDYLHFDPVGQTLVSIQEITNDLISLTLQTIEHGIGQTFADPAVLNFDAYEQSSVLPGGIFPAKARTGGTLEQGFKELRTAQLSPEVMPFGQSIQTMGQLVSGATPSIFGGQLSGVGGETASGYSMSRAQAMQRLQNTWKLFTTLWKNVFGKVIPMYISIVKEDERDVQRTDDGNFVNVLIKKAELEGKIGKVELEANENLPMTWAQKKDMLFTMLQATNPKIMEILNAPENIGLIHEALGLVDFYVPGEDDIIKQYDEIKLLLESEPIEQPPDEIMMLESMQSGMPPPPPERLPSIEIDPIYDNHIVEFGICRKWIISEAGRQTKTTNPAGYENVLLHGRLHFLEIQKMQMQQAQSQESGAVPDAKPDKTKQEAPITGEGDVQTVS